MIIAESILIAPVIRTLYQNCPSRDYGGSILGFGQATREQLLSLLQGHSSLSYRDGNDEIRIPSSVSEVLINCNRDSVLLRVSGVGPVASENFLSPDFSSNDGLIRVFTVDESNNILMDASMNQEAFEITMETRKAVYFSRSRNKLWPKGKTSGNVQNVIGCHVIGTGLAIRLVVEQIGRVACHDNYERCFYRRLNRDGTAIIIAQKLHRC